jgi:hypothetical protein
MEHERGDWSLGIYWWGVCLLLNIGGLERRGVEFACDEGLRDKRKGLHVENLKAFDDPYRAARS